MAYKTYITDALVCGVNNSNTSDRSYLLFTREAGMLFANARSVRKETSKQRYALQEFSLVRVTLIRGKSGWRIGSVESLHNYYDCAYDKEARGSVVTLLRCLRRFVHGEESATQLFDLVLEALALVEKKVPERSFVDAVIQLRVLSTLGYVSETTIPEELSKTTLKEVPKIYNESLMKQLQGTIEKSISASHL